MDDCEKEAQDLGYKDGINNWGKKHRKQFEPYSNLLAAYDRGYAFGHTDYEWRMSQICRDI